MIINPDQIDQPIHKKYNINQKLGRGAYGVVWKATDKKNGAIVALKKIFMAFQNETDAQRTFREIMFLQELNHHENIIKLINVIKAENNIDIYLVFEYMETDLHTVIEAEILEDIHKQYIIYQLLRALKYLHTGNLIHRDVKPSNLLLNSNCCLKLGDFGLARSLDQCTNEKGPNIVLTDYIATRWYRAPEIILGSRKYSKSVDMWSSGCILGELLKGKPLFPGSSMVNQLDRILEITGKISAKDLESIESPFAKHIYLNIRLPKTKRMIELIPGASKDAIDMSIKLLQFNPEKRITVESALNHPYMEKFHNPQNEPSCSRIISIPVDDNTKLNISGYRNKLYQEIFKRKIELKKKMKTSKRLQELSLDHHWDPMVNK